MIVRRALIAVLLAALFLAPAAGRAAAGAASATDYEAELARLQKDIDDTQATALNAPVDFEKALRYVFAVYRKASLTSDFKDFKAAETVIDRALEQIGPLEDLYLLKANFDFKLHRLAATAQDLEKVPDKEDEPGVKALRADLALQEGRYDEARKGYESALRKKKTWDNLARLAYLKSRTGDAAGADKLYLAAEDDITAKEMRSYAWVDLQRGLLDFDAHRYEKALAHYRTADRAYSGYWLIEEHIAEVLDLTGQTKDAIALYEKIIGTTHNPEYLNALGRIRERSDPDAAQKLYAEADRRNEERFALYPEAAIGHLIRDTLVRRTPRPDLLELAQRNYDLRPNGESKLLLARAYLKAERRAEAKKLLDEIASTPWTTPELSLVRRQVGG